MDGIVRNIDFLTEKKKYTKKWITKTKGEQVILQTREKIRQETWKKKPQEYNKSNHKQNINICQQITWQSYKKNQNVII